MSWFGSSGAGGETSAVAFRVVARYICGARYS
jgi:hypothetical protein